MILTFANLSTGDLRSAALTPIAERIGRRMRDRLARAYEDMVPLADEGALAGYRFAAEQRLDALFVTVAGVSGLYGVYATSAGPAPQAWAEIHAIAQDARPYWGYSPIAEPAGPWSATTYGSHSLLDGATRRQIEDYQAYLAWAWLLSPALAPEPIPA